MKISVLGCGRWGSFIAWYLCNKGYDVCSWGPEGDYSYEVLRTTGKNEYVTLDKRIRLTCDLEEAVTRAEIIVISISSQGLRGFVERILAYDVSGKDFVLCMKGIEVATGDRLSQVLVGAGISPEHIAVWVGPGHIQAFTQGIPNCMVIDSASETLKKRLADNFKSELIRFYYGEDLIGTEIGAAAKNVMGIVAGVLDGCGYASLKGSLMSRGAREVARLWVTASGGPFRGRTRGELAAITPAQALAHPTWSMGAKISIDSSTLMNKGLEVIEAHHLFGMPYDRISVVVQPQSAIHSMVEYSDGSVKAHLGTTDMRIPIQFALSYPERWDAPVEPLDFTKLGSLEFAAPDTGTFRCLALARAAGERGGTLPCAMNAANEVAVAAFLAEEGTYLGIAACVEAVMDAHEVQPVESLEQLEAVDAWARARAREWIAAQYGAAALLQGRRGRSSAWKKPEKGVGPGGILSAW